MMEKRSHSSGGGINQSNRKPPSPKKNKAADPRTLFVKFHPPSASITRQHLSDHFSNYGPVNRCSVIRQKQPKFRKSLDAVDGEENDGNTNYDRGSKGYGFVRFVHEDDAKSAAEAILRKKQANDGKGRNKKGRGGGGGGGGDVMIVDGIEYIVHAERAVDAATASASSPHKKKERGATTTTPEAGKQDPTPPATSTKDATTPTKTTPTKTTPTKTTPSKEDTEALYKEESKRKRTSRVILRNLSFYANEKHVKTAMESNFGPVVAVDLPLVPDLPKENNNNKTEQHGKKKKNAVPRHRGFAFVTFANANSAKKAVERGNAQIQIKNRAVAIDFSVSKAEHQRMAAEAAKNKGADTESDSDDSDSDEDGDEEKNSDGSSDSESGSEGDSSDSSDDSDSDSESEGESDEEEEDSTKENTDTNDDNDTAKETPAFDETEARRTLFLRNVPFDAKRHDVFELFRKFGRIEAAYLVKDRQTGVFKGTAFVRFEKVDGCAAAMEASGGAEANEGDSSMQQQFVSSKNMAMGLGEGGEASGGLTLNGRRILVDFAVDRTTASSLAVQRDADGKPIKKSVGKDRRNLYLKNEGRVTSSADNDIAASAGATHGGVWEDLPPGDRARRERAFADKSTKLRSPLFFINPKRISVRNLAKSVTESELKNLVFGALKKGLEKQLATPQDAVAHWRAGGELPHAEVMRRATDQNLVVPPLDEKNVRGAIPSVYIDRDTTGGKKTADAPSRGFGFVEFAHHAHALAALRQLNNNPAYSEEYAAGGKHAAAMLKQKRGKKGKTKADPETGAEFVGEDGRVCVPRLIVELTAENKVKARQQAEKIAQKKANKIKQRIEKKEKQREEEDQQPSDDKKKEKKKGRGALQREKKRARKEDADGDGDDAQTKDGKDSKKKQKLDENSTADKSKEKKVKKVKPQKKRKVDKDDDALEDMIRSYKSSFSKGTAGEDKASAEEGAASDDQTKKKKKSRENVAKKRWFE